MKTCVMGKFQIQLIAYIENILNSTKFLNVLTVIYLHTLFLLVYIYIYIYIAILGVSKLTCLGRWRKAHSTSVFYLFRDAIAWAFPMLCLFALILAPLRDVHRIM